MLVTVLVNGEHAKFLLHILHFIILLHWENRLTYQCPSSWPIVTTMKKKFSRHFKRKYRLLAGGPNEWQQVCNRSNPEKTGRSCERTDFSWLSSKVCRTLTCCRRERWGSWWELRRELGTERERAFFDGVCR
jgi:hypothetical protein